MLIDFLFELRSRKIPVSTHEWMALMEAMALGLHESSVDGFYHLCRTICVKDIAYYDAYDEAVLAYFKYIHQQGEAHGKINISFNIDIHNKIYFVFFIIQ